MPRWNKIDMGSFRSCLRPKLTYFRRNPSFLSPAISIHHSVSPSSLPVWRTSFPRLWRTTSRLPGEAVGAGWGCVPVALCPARLSLRPRRSPSRSPIFQNRCHLPPPYLTSYSFAIVGTTEGALIQQKQITYFVTFKSQASHSSNTSANYNIFGQGTICQSVYLSKPIPERVRITPCLPGKSQLSRTGLKRS